MAELELMPATSAPTVVKHAQQAFTVWSQTALTERLSKLTPFLTELKKHKEDLARLITQEMGRPIKEARTEVDKAAEACEFMLKHAENFLQSEKTEIEPGIINELQFIPMGVVLSISPWNYPLQLALYSIFPALICGNSVIHKPARKVPLLGLKINEILTPLLPPHTFQTIIASSVVAQNIIEDEINMVALIGSTAAGRDIMRRSSKRLHNISLELGGKDAFIVLPDADLELVAKQAVVGSIKNAGQACNAVERIYVPKKLEKLFADYCVAEAKKIVVGNPMDETVTMGPLATQEQLTLVEEHILDAINKGACVLYGGRRLPGPGNFYEPTVVVDVNSTMSLMTEETFGPVIAIQGYETADEAVKLANEIPYGLAASVWTSNLELGKDIANNIHAGNVGINQLCRSHPAVPWGGTKQSGIGRTLGKYGFRAFTEMRNVRYKA